MKTSMIAIIAATLTVANSVAMASEDRPSTAELLSGGNSSSHDAGESSGSVGNGHMSDDNNSDGHDDNNSDGGDGNGESDGHDANESDGHDGNESDGHDASGNEGHGGDDAMARMMVIVAATVKVTAMVQAATIDPSRS